MFVSQFMICYSLLFQYTDTVVLDNYNPFPRSEFMKKFKVKLGTSMGGQSSTLGTPSPEECLLDLVNRQLKVGYGIYIHMVLLLWMTHTYKVCVREYINGFAPKPRNFIVLNVHER